MDARCLVFALIALIASVTPASGQSMIGYRVAVETANFRVFAADPGMANEVAKAAEAYRRDLAVHWLGEELPNWPAKIPINVEAGPRLLASGETKYYPSGNTVRDFQMVVRGTNERILDSVLPHEITHTILASHFIKSGRLVPRWADEGACTTVEHEEERQKNDHMLVRYLTEGRGIPFKVLFELKEYPPDMYPLYAQGYSLSCFLIAQGGPQHFIRFLQRGAQDEDWASAVDEFYGYPMLGKLQIAWNNWVQDGGGSVDSHTAVALGYSNRNLQPNAVVASNASVPSNDRSPVRLAAGEIGASTRSAMSTNPSRSESDRSSTGFYQQQLQIHQNSSLAGGNNQGALPTSPTSNSIPYRVSQPVPFQTVGGSTVRR